MEGFFTSLSPFSIRGRDGNPRRTCSCCRVLMISNIINTAGLGSFKLAFVRYQKITSEITYFPEYHGNESRLHIPCLPGLQLP